VTDVDLCPIHNLRMMPECPDCIWITAPTAQMIAEGYAVHWHEHDKDRPSVPPTPAASRVTSLRVRGGAIGNTGMSLRARGSRSQSRRLAHP
jgi:hypothetical protein